MRKLVYNIIECKTPHMDDVVRFPNCSKDEVILHFNNWIVDPEDDSDFHIFVHECVYDLPSGELINEDTGDVHDI